MRKYKTSEHQRSDLKLRRDAIKAAGGLPYQELLARERKARTRYRKRHPEKTRAERKRYEKTQPNYHRRRLLMAARRRARKAGLEATIRVSDVVWPTHCPVLGIELDYPIGQRKDCVCKGNFPSLDRWDNTKGYVAGNVFVISFRANSLKSNATVEELQAIAAYLQHGAGALRTDQQNR